jgi:hypothetical protein
VCVMDVCAPLLGLVSLSLNLRWVCMSGCLFLPFRHSILLGTDNIHHPSNVCHNVAAVGWGSAHTQATLPAGVAGLAATSSAFQFCDRPLELVHQ